MRAHKVVACFTVHGTHKGGFMGIAPTGKRVALEEIRIWRIAEGKIVEHWGIMDMLGLMLQLGAIPPTGKPQK